MSAAAGLRSLPSNAFGEVRGGQAHMPGSPSTSGRGDVPQHARSESLGSDTHLQACPHPRHACCVASHGFYDDHNQATLTACHIRCVAADGLLAAQQALASRLGSGTQYGADALRLAESPRSRASNSSEQYDSLGRGQAHSGYRYDQARTSAA